MNGHPAGRIYISRAEEDDIGRELDAVRADHTSRAVLLYGDGGVGKTSLVRHMADMRVDDGTVWLQPVDVDDPEIWLLSNLEHRVADQLDDPDGHYFAAYRRELSRLPSATSADISHETIISYLNRLRDVFTGCYADYISAGKKTVVIVFDTVETIRGTNLARTLTQWMKALPADTLFILSGLPRQAIGTSSRRSWTADTGASPWRPSRSAGSAAARHTTTSATVASPDD